MTIDKEKKIYVQDVTLRDGMHAIRHQYGVDHIKAICERMRDHGEKLRAAIGATDDAGDANTADLFTAASRTADKDLWFLESHLE